MADVLGEWGKTMRIAVVLLVCSLCACWILSAPSVVVLASVLGTILACGHRRT